MLNAQRMIRVNLIPAAAEQTESRVKVPTISSFAPYAALGVVIGILALISIVQSIRIGRMNAKISALETESRQLAPLIQRIEMLTRERQLAGQRLQVIERLDQDRLARVRLVDELARRVPDYVWFSSFAEKGGIITINGVTFSNLTVAELIRSLERSVLYEQVDLGISQRGEIAGRDVVNFTLNARRQTAPDPVPIEPTLHQIGTPQAGMPAAPWPAPGASAGTTPAAMATPAALMPSPAVSPAAKSAVARAKASAAKAEAPGKAKKTGH